ncbi:MAG: histidine phosphatase family protein [Nocardioides sp.]|uniref:histidine phosphatase family protein n=1 Tax=Nocardioides sp. TaxID=35761 RepID=UPI0039E5E9C3
MRLLLIRHGQTPSNVSGALDTGIPGPGLTELGRAQARAIPEALAGQRIGAISASPMIRTQFTAAPLAERLGLPVTVRAGLEEISAGDLAMNSDRDSVEAYQQTLHEWVTGNLDHAIPGAADGHAFLRRYDAAIAAVAAETIRADGADGVAVVVSHGAAIRLWSALRSDAGHALATQHRLGNTGMIVLDGAPDSGWRMERWHGDPIGGVGLADVAAHDVTGDADPVESEESNAS